MKLILGSGPGYKKQEGQINIIDNRVELRNGHKVLQVRLSK